MVGVGDLVVLPRAYYLKSKNIVAMIETLLVKLPLANTYQHNITTQEPLSFSKVCCQLTYWYLGVNQAISSPILGGLDYDSRFFSGYEFLCNPRFLALNSC